jgi:hypothetical protein
MNRTVVEAAKPLGSAVQDRIIAGTDGHAGSKGVRPSLSLGRLRAPRCLPYGRRHAGAI